MELIINELSFLPLAETSTQVEDRFRGLIKSFECAKKTYGFSHMCFPQNYTSIQVTIDDTFIQWIGKLKTPIIKDLILGLCKKPYTDDLNDGELTEFYKSSYTILDNDVPTKEEPYGLPVAHIKSLPAISINSHVFWNRRKIAMRKSGIEVDEIIDFFVFNICKEHDIKEKELSEWANSSFSASIRDEKALRLYLNYTKYTITFEHEFMEQLLKWKKGDQAIYKNVLMLMKDVELHPFTGGMGKTENLKGKGKEASKRVTHEDRLSYTLDSDIINFIACIGHYDFH
jgi:toxin YoeB